MESTKKTTKKKLSMRKELVRLCNSLQENLDSSLKPYLEEENHHLGYIKYYHRHKLLSEALTKFINKPGNFHSLNEKGLAELIFNAAPIDSLSHYDIRIFKLHYIQIKIDTVNTEQSKQAQAPFGQYELSKLLSKAYAQEVYPDPHNKEAYKYSGADWINSELSAFFSSIKDILLRKETETAITTKRIKAKIEKNSKKHHSFLDPSDEPDYDNRNNDLVLERALQRNSITNSLSKLKCCNHCFRLIHQRPGEGKAKFGATCDLHNPKTNNNLYKRALKINNKKNAWDRKQLSNGKSKGEYINPFWTPKRLQLLMTLALTHQKWEQPSALFYATLDLMKADSSSKEYPSLISHFKELILMEFPPIAEPDLMVQAIAELEEKLEHCPENIHKIIAKFVKDEKLPFFPEMIAVYMEFYAEEARFSQEYYPEYYNPNLGIGRPPKLDKNAILAEAARLKMSRPEIGKGLTALLAKKYSYTPQTIRKIIENLPKDLNQSTIC